MSAAGSYSPGAPPLSVRPPCSLALPLRRVPARPGGSPRDKISVQLYTLRDQLAIDLDASLAELRAIGYTRVEQAGFVGRTAAQFRAALDAAGIRATSGHVAIPQPWDATAWERALEDANVVGNHSIVHPYFGGDASGKPIRDGAVYRAFAADLNKAGQLAHRAGLDF
jgi:sugar phosphate isomerase/epimerase